jgi:hypothetical protein
VLKIASNGVISGFRCGVSEISPLLAFNAVYYGAIFGGEDGIDYVSRNIEKSYHSTLRNILRGTQFSLRYIPVDAAVYVESSLT